MSLTYERVRELFDYREDGNLIRKVSGYGNNAGSMAGTLCGDGYYNIQIDYEKHYAHRVVWLWHHGYMPESQIDHINRARGDNRIENLREVSHQCNLRNSGNPRDNKSGVKGVYTSPKLGNVWLARITSNRKTYHLGTFKCFDEAVLHRLAAEQCLDWEGCDSSSPAYQYATKNGLVHEETC